MTHRAEREYSAVELATKDTLDRLSDFTSTAHHHHKPPMSEKAFRRMLALHLSDKSTREWCELLGVDPPEGAD